MAQLTSPFCNIFLQRRQKIVKFRTEKSVFAGGGAVTAPDSVVRNSRSSLIAVAVSLFPSLAYFVIYFKCIIT
jgi:hypothetical protein